MDRTGNSQAISEGTRASARCPASGDLPDCPVFFSEEHPGEQPINVSAGDGASARLYQAEFCQLIESLATEVMRPLATIATAAESSLRWIERDPSDAARQARISATISRSALQAAHMVGRYRELALASISGVSDHDINEILLEAAEDYRASLVHGGIRFLDNLGANLPKVRGCRAQLRMVAANLLRNAVEALADHAGARHIRLSSGLHAGMVFVEITDSGPGFGGHQDFAFEGMYTTRPASLGMGLTVCRVIMILHDGRIHAGDLPQGGGWVRFALRPAEHPSQGSAL